MIPTLTNPNSSQSNTIIGKILGLLNNFLLEHELGYGKIIDIFKAKRIRDVVEISQWTLEASRSANAKESDFGAKKVVAKINCIAEYFEKSNEDDLNPDVIEG